MCRNLGRVRPFPAQADHLPSEIGARLAFAIQTSFVQIRHHPARCPHDLERRRSAADIDSATKGLLAVKIAFLQNTLEQAFLGVGAHLLLASVAGDRWLELLVASPILFAVGRWSFYHCYPGGAGARAVGMATTAPASLTCYLVALAMLVGRLFGG